MNFFFPLFLLLVSNVCMANALQIGDAAPDFALPSQTGQKIRLSDFCGKKIVVLFFYPKDNTPGCTAEVCTFRDSFEIFKEAGAELIGISSDDAASHEKFSSQHHLPFLLLSDEGGKIRKTYGVASTLGLLPGRVTYVIDRKGTVRHIFSSQFNPKKHVEEALKIIKAL